MQVPELPLSLTAARKPVLDRAFSHLPESLLESLRSGLDRHDGRLAPGQLYQDDGGCAVGVMLQEIFPAARGRTLRDRLLRRRQRSVYEVPMALGGMTLRLSHIELVFDNTIREAQQVNPRYSEAHWAQAVGRWIAGCATAELERRARAPHELMFAPAHWFDKQAAGSKPKPGWQRMPRRQQPLAVSTAR